MEFERFRPNLAGNRQPTSEFRQNLGPIWPQLGPNLAPIWPNSAEVVPRVSPNLAEFVWLDSIVPRTDLGPTVVDSMPNFADIGRLQSEFCRRRANFGRSGANFGRYPSSLLQHSLARNARPWRDGQFGAEFGRIWPTSGGSSGRSVGRLARLRTTLAGAGRTAAPSSAAKLGS